jgi:hypothetical protein
MGCGWHRPPKELAEGSYPYLPRILEYSSKMVKNTPKSLSQTYLWWFALLAALTGAIVWQHALRRPEREAVTFPTALADHRYVPASLAVVGAAFSMNLPGQSVPQPCRVAQILMPTESPAAEKLEKVGQETNGRFAVYRALHHPGYLVQVAPARFATVE